MLNGLWHKCLSSMTDDLGDYELPYFLQKSWSSTFLKRHFLIHQNCGSDTPWTFDVFLMKFIAFSFLRKTAKGVLLTLKSIQFLFRPCLFCSPFFDSIETWKIVSWKAKFFKIYVDWISIDRGQLFFVFSLFLKISPQKRN